MSWSAGSMSRRWRRDAAGPAVLGRGADDAAGQADRARREIAAAERAGEVGRVVGLRRQRVVECGLMWGVDDVAKMTGLYAALVSAVEHIPPEALDSVAEALRPLGVRLTGRRAAA